MITIRKSEDRGHFDHGWLDTYHTFSFADYHDPRHVHFRALRVLNEDRVAPGQGFGMHPHRDMEIITYVVSGALEHRDSMGHGAVIRPDEIQAMTAGTGVHHSEFNASQSESVHLLQIWVLPRQHGLRPEYRQRRFDRSAARGTPQLLISPDGRDGSLSVHQDVTMLRILLPAGSIHCQSLGKGRNLWVQMIAGRIELAGTRLQAGDGAAVSGEPNVDLRALDEVHALLFELG